MAVATVVAVLWGGLGVTVTGPGAGAAPVKEKLARDLPALPSDRAPRLRPAVPDGDFADAPGRGRPQAPSPLRPSAFDKDRSRVVERTERSDVFANPDGSRTAQVHAQPVNFQDGSGAWRPIDTRVVADGAGFRNGGGPLAARFAARGDAAGVVKVSAGAAAASFSMDGAAPAAASPTGSTVRYPGVAPGVDLEYQVGARSVKELVVLRQPPSAGASATFRFPLQLDGLTPELAEDGFDQPA